MFTVSPPLPVGPESFRDNRDTATFSPMKKISFAFFSLPPAASPEKKRRLTRLLVETKTVHQAVKNYACLFYFKCNGW